MEQKTDTIFEIINNMVKEISVLKEYTIVKFRASEPSTVPSSIPVSIPIQPNISKIVVSDDEESEFSDDAYSSDCDDDDDDDTDDSDCDDDNDVPELVTDPMVIASESLPLESVDELPTISETVQDTVIPDLSISDATSQIIPSESTIQEPMALDEVEDHSGDDVQEEVQQPDSTTKATEVTDTNNSFSSWNVKELREYIVSNGLISNLNEASKLKKNDILKMIQRKVE